MIDWLIMVYVIDYLIHYCHAWLYADCIMIVHDASSW
jgi:hypothetical protein